MSIGENVSIGFDQYNITGCFTNYTYIVPDYQREYVWDEDPKKSQVEELLHDIEEAYENNKQQYFVGTIVVYKNGQNLEIIDGQQRLTTFFIFLCALHHLYDDYGKTSETIKKLIYSSVMDSEGNEKEAYHLQLQYSDASSCLEKIFKRNLIPNSDMTKSENRLFSAYEKIYDEIKEKCRNIDSLKPFAAFVIQKIIFVQIENTNRADALKIFETINQRGIGLNPMDLLKNMIFMQVDRDKFNSLNSEWKEIITTLEQINEKPLRFMRYYIMGTYDTSKEKDRILREERIYQWITENDNQCGYREDPIGFVRKMSDGATKYKSFLNPVKDDEGDQHLSNIFLFAGKTYRLHLMLLLAADKMDDKLLKKFKGILEVVIYYSTITQKRTNEMERTFSQWCPKIREISDDASMNEFLKSSVIPVVNRWKKEYHDMFRVIGLENTQKYRIRFILARISQYIEDKRRGAGHNLSNVLVQGIEIEHIMPQKPDNIYDYGMIDENEFKDFDGRIGNLTLLEKTLNSVIKNKPYKDKCETYIKSQLYMTSSIPKLVDEGKNTAINRLNKKLRSWREWNKESIVDRQEMLYNLSEEVWNLNDYI